MMIMIQVVSGRVYYITLLPSLRPLLLLLLLGGIPSNYLIPRMYLSHAFILYHVSFMDIFITCPLARAETPESNPHICYMYH